MIFDFLLRRSTAFRKVFYTGSNEKAAAYSGIRTKRVIFFTTVLCSTLCGVAGIIYMARFGSAQPTFGIGMELNVIAAAVIGGASLSGGQGTIFGAILGRGAAVGGVELAGPARRLGLLAGHHPRLHPARRGVVRPLPSQAKGDVRASMKVTNDFHRYEAARQIYSVLVMHFQEGITQAEIAKLTKLSHAKVNRLIKQGREMGMVEIDIRSPYQALFDLEARFREATGLETVRITPTASANPRDHPAPGRRRRGEPPARDAAGRRHRLHHRRQGRQRRRRQL